MGPSPNLEPLVLGCWLGSRLLFFVPLFIAVAVSPARDLSFRLSQWDAAHYLQIVNEGYRGDNFAFFPLFPYSTKMLSHLVHAPPLWVGLLLANAAFLVALVALHRLTWQCLGKQAAQATVVLTCLNPMSIFFSIPYTESFYLLFTTLSLVCLVQRPIRAPLVAILGALSASTRPIGVTIVASILVAFVRQHRAATGLLVGLLALGGLGAVVLLNLHLSGDPLAFLHAESAWNASPGFNLSGVPFWQERLSKVFLGPASTKAQAIVDPFYPVLMGASLSVGAVAFRLRRTRPSLSFMLSLVAFLAYWLIGGMPALTLLVVLGAILLCVWGFGRLPFEIWIFGAGSLSLYLLKQNPMSLERYVFATVPLLMLHGAYFGDHRRWMIFLAGFGSVLLVIYALRFAQGQWIG